MPSVCILQPDRCKSFYDNWSRLSIDMVSTVDAMSKLLILMGLSSIVTRVH